MSADKNKPQTAEDGERIAKFLARSGVASRREVERLIEAGKVTVNGKRLDTPAFKVDGSEKIVVDGEPVEPIAPAKLWLYHKPAGLVTTHKDPEGRQTVFEALPKDIGRVISVGRLDLTSEGLLLLTNDGGLARALELPSTGWTRRYRARAFGSVDEAGVNKLRSGITVEGVRYGKMEVEVERETGSNVWLNIGLKEGKNREVRRVLEAIGLRVNRLIRISYGPFQLGQIEKGEVKAVPGRILKDQCGHLLSDNAAAMVGDGEARAKKPAGRRPSRGSATGKPQGGAPGRTQGGSEGKYGGKPGGKPGGRPSPKPRTRR